MALHIFLIPVIIIANFFLSSTSEDIEKEFRVNCLALSKKCAESRIKREIEDLSFVFRDVIYHYCLDLYHCAEGKRIVCHHVRPSETEYVEKSQRKRVLKQCQDWKIPVKFDTKPVSVPIVEKGHSRMKVRRVRKILKRHNSEE